MSELKQEVKKNAIDILYKRIQDMRDGEKKFLLGNILTVIDGVIWDTQQRKAVKDVIERLWYQENYYWYLEKLLEQFRTQFTKIEEGQTSDFLKKNNNECYSVNFSSAHGNYFSEIK